MRTILIALLVIGTTTPALAQTANPDLEKAKKQYAELYYEEAQVSLQKALQFGVSSIEQTADTCIVTRICELKLSIQPRTGGIKHLNRLEQVLVTQP